MKLLVNLTNSLSLTPPNQFFLRMKHIKEFLTQPFLMWEYTTIRKIVAILSIQVYNAAFFYFFTPFDYNTLTNQNLLINILINLVWTTFVLSVFYFLVPFGFKGYFKDKNRTFFREIMWVLGVLFFASAGHRYINNSIFKFQYHSIIDALALTISIGVFPVLILLLLAIIRMVRESSNENVNIANQLIEVKSIIGNDEIKLFLKDILFFKSLDNYAEVYFTNGSNTEIKRKIIRISLTELNKQLNSEYFIRSHRSYIVNLFHIEKVEGNSNVSKIYQKGNNSTIPISRSRRQEVLKTLNKLPLSYTK